jgi:8-oxo-dGTP diphosphatase
MSEFNFQMLHQDLFPNRSIEQSFTFSSRPTVKVVLMDSDNKICLTSKKESGFYFLPGGGIENTEDPIEALKRECLEEAGCHIAVKHKIGTITEHRDEAKEKRIVSCYIGNVLGEKLSPTLAIGDEEGFDVIWMSKEEAVRILEKQLSLISEQTINFYNRKFNTVRDLKILSNLD